MPTNQPRNEAIEAILHLYRRGIERDFGGRTVGKTLTEDQAHQAITTLLVEARIAELSGVKSCFNDLQDTEEAVYIEANYADYRIAELQAQLTTKESK